MFYMISWVTIENKNAGIKILQADFADLHRNSGGVGCQYANNWVSAPGEESVADTGEAQARLPGFFLRQCPGSLSAALDPFPTPPVAHLRLSSGKGWGLSELRNMGNEELLVEIVREKINKNYDYHLIFVRISYLWKLRIQNQLDMNNWYHFQPRVRTSSRPI